MAEKKTVAATEAAPAPKDPRKDLVPFYAFKDSDRYSDDIVVGVNGKLYKIKRGVEVMIPRHVYAVLKNSMEQDNKTADFIARETERYRSESKIFE